ncbi:hypothetical protein [Reinekea marinisedimentorum]|uniref:Zinc ribbon protein n=1 Tax=Reinekea marinisedimentorum TaxID=230495 RepID=A0A4R3IC20_9GAMM|nr:hypothetical protein [Reinekea marinisedimentorum]TCS43096.1 hypothetical protein BCF53_102119 [Reinekea marinisedimentorum]
MDLTELMNTDDLLADAEANNAVSQRLIHQVEHLSNLCQAFYECLSDAGIDNSTITRKLSEINERTNETEYATNGFLTECHSCGKLVSSRHSYCTSCGTRLTKSFIL